MVIQGMITVRDLAVFSSGAVLASMQMSACGEEERAPLAEHVFSGEEEEPQDPRLNSVTEEFSERDCWSKVPGHVQQCGVVRVPESAGSEQMLELAVVRILAKHSESKDAPLVYLSGGPGSGVVGDLGVVFPAFAPLALDRDLVFFDQRGTGASLPVLDCEGAEDISGCHELVSRRVDPSAFNSKESARDLEVIRRALGYLQWNLLGVSYGTRLALTVLRDFPAGVRAAIIDAVVPLQVDLLGKLTPNGLAAFETLFAACSAEASCKDRYPEPMAGLLEVAATLDEDPVDADGLELDGAAFVNVLYNLLYSPEALRYIPFLIERAKVGDFGLLESLAFGLSRGSFAFGMHLSVQCAEEMPFTSAELIAEEARGIPAVLHRAFGGADYVDYCRDWSVEKAPDQENEAVRSAIPTLALGGRFDPITPSSYTELAAETLGLAHVFLFEGEAHGSSLSACGLELVGEFLDRPERAPQAACVLESPEPGFERGSPPGVARKKRAYHAGTRIRFATEAPSSHQVQLVRRDLERRLRL